MTRLALLPSPRLAHVVRYFHVERGGAGAVMIPASPFPIVTFFSSGGSLSIGAGGGLALFADATVCGPVTMPFPAVWQQGTTFVSALLYPTAFAPLFGIGPAELRNMPVPLDDILPGQQAIADAVRATKDLRGQVALIEAWLLALLARHDGRQTPFALPSSLVNLPAQDIATRCGLSVRQFERRFQASYGQTLRDARRMGRYVRALAQLMHVPPRRGVLTRIAMDAGYHDQAHMIRDFVHFTGTAPGALQGDDPLLRLYRYADESRMIVTRDVVSIQ
jgi:AraC-like DNA-binding protein